MNPKLIEQIEYLKIVNNAFFKEDIKIKKSKKCWKINLK